LVRDRPQTSEATQRLTEEAAYAVAVEEFESGNRRPGLWGKAFAESEGDLDKASALYIKLRVQSLFDEAQLILNDEREAERKELEKRKKTKAEQKEAKWESRRKAAMHTAAGAGDGLRILLFFFLGLPIIMGVVFFLITFTAKVVSGYAA